MLWFSGNGKGSVQDTIGEIDPSYVLEVRINSGSKIRLPRMLDIDQTHSSYLINMLNPFWGFLVVADEEMMSGRLRSSHPILAVYGPHWQDQSRTVPLVLLETVFTRTGGDPKKLPDHYNTLTNYGRWPTNIPSNYDTVTLTDLTKADKDVPKECVSFAVKQSLHFFAPYQAIQSPFTYSPALEGVLRMHEGNGAVRSGVKKEYARIPEQFVSMRNGERTIDEAGLSAYLKSKNVHPNMLHVEVMDYTPELQRIRNSQRTTYFTMFAAPFRNLMGARSAT